MFIRRIYCLGCLPLQTCLKIQLVYFAQLDNFGTKAIAQTCPIALPHSVLTARRRRVPTFLLGSVVMASAVALAVGLLEPRWSVGHAHLVSTYCMYKEGMFVSADITLSIGVDHYNVSYYNTGADAEHDGFEFYYNNRFEMVFGGPGDNKPDNKMKAIEMGLPNPMIVVGEYMSTYGGGFEWGLAIPAAAYYTGVVLQGCE
jgi:hypothetical protein